MTVEFLGKGTSTEVVLTHEQFADEHMRDENNQGWSNCLHSLARLLAATEVNALIIQEKGQ